MGQSNFSSNDVVLLPRSSIQRREEKHVIIHSHPERPLAKTDWEWATLAVDMDQTFLHGEGRAFQVALMSRSMICTVRATRGDAESSACGQLATAGA